MKRINTTLKEERMKLGITQTELALRLGIVQSHVRLIEMGERVPGVLLAIHIANYFGKTVEEMFWK